MWYGERGERNPFHKTVSVKFKLQPLKRKSLSESNTVRLAYEPSAPTTGPTSPDYPKDRPCRSALKLASRVKQLASHHPFLHPPPPTPMLFSILCPFHISLQRRIFSGEVAFFQFLIQAHCHFKCPIQALRHQFVGFLVHRYNDSVYCGVVGHPPAPLHEQQWPE